MNGTIPSELSALSSIEIISLSVGNLYGTLPSELGDLNTLKFLQLVGNMLTGTIPKTFEKLTSLEVISFYNNMLSGTIPFEFTQSGYNWEIVDFARNNFLGTIPEFVTKSPIERIYVEENQLEGTLPSSLYTLNALQFLSFSYNKLTGTIGEQIGALEDLWFLDASNNNFSGPLPPKLGNAEDLEYAFLGDNQFSGSVPSEIGNLENLNRLILSSNMLNGTLPENLGNLGDLTVLDVSKNQLSGIVPSSFVQLTSLTRYALSENNITGGLDVAFCNRPQLITEIEADCLGETSDLNCECCTSCCDDETCSLNVFAICETKASKFELDAERGAACTCTEDGTSVTCSDTTCESCNLDESVCAINKDYGYNLNGTTGEIVSFQNTMEYVTGFDGTTITYEDLASDGCSVSVNGEECRSCGSIICGDGSEGFMIFCDNLENGFNFLACEEFITVDYLEVFYFHDGSALSGCPPLLERLD